MSVAYEAPDVGQPITMLNAAGQALPVLSSMGADGNRFSVMCTSASDTTAPVNPRGYGG